MPKLKKLENDRLSARVIFSCVDLKFTKDGEVKILEFGRGIQSGFKGFEGVSGKSFGTRLDEVFKEYSLPRLVLNSHRSRDVLDDTIIRKEALNPALHQDNTQTERLASYSMTYMDSTLGVLPSRCLPIDDPIVSFAFEDKALTHSYFVRSGQENTRPNTLLLSLKNPQDYPRLISERFPDTQRFVLKMPDREGGRGVMVLPLKDLLVILQILKRANKSTLLSPEESALLGQNAKKLSDWLDTGVDRLLIEEYVTSKPVIQGEKMYDATMRVAFVFVRDNGEVRCHPFACYWKLPPNPITFRGGTLADMTISSFSPDRISAVQVNEEDQKIVFERLSVVLPSLILSMMPLESVLDYIARLSPTQNQTAGDLWMHFSNTLAHHGYYAEAVDYLERALPLIKESAQVLFQRSMIYYLAEQYERAIEYCTQALRTQHYNPELHFHRAKCLVALNRIADAEIDLHAANDRDPNYKSRIQRLLVDAQAKQDRMSAIAPSYATRRPR